MTTRIKLRRDTASNWTTANPTLALGEPGYETDTGSMKIGDGVTAWTSLDYVSALPEGMIGNDFWGVPTLTLSPEYISSGPYVGEAMVAQSHYADDNQYGWSAIGWEDIDSDNYTEVFSDSFGTSIGSWSEAQGYKQWEFDQYGNSRFPSGILITDQIAGMENDEGIEGAGNVFSYNSSTEATISNDFLKLYGNATSFGSTLVDVEGDSEGEDEAATYNIRLQSMTNFIEPFFESGSPDYGRASLVWQDFNSPVYNKLIVDPLGTSIVQGVWPSEIGEGPVPTLVWQFGTMVSGVEESSLALTAATFFPGDLYLGNEGGGDASGPGVLYVNQVQAQAGGIGADPLAGYTFQDDGSGTGMYETAPSTIGLYAGSTNVVQITTSGANVSGTLTVNGNGIFAPTKSASPNQTGNSVTLNGYTFTMNGNGNFNVYTANSVYVSMTGSYQSISGTSPTIVTQGYQALSDAGLYISGSVGYTTVGDTFTCNMYDYTNNNMYRVTSVCTQSNGGGSFNNTLVVEQIY
jgi:hypothetical protein